MADVPTRWSRAAHGFFGPRFNRKIGALLMGLRRLEMLGAAPAIDCAVQEEMLETTSGPVRIEPTHDESEYYSDTRFYIRLPATIFIFIQMTIETSDDDLRAHYAGLQIMTNGDKQHIIGWELEPIAPLPPILIRINQTSASEWTATQFCDGSWAKQALPQYEHEESIILTYPPDRVWLRVIVYYAAKIDVYSCEDDFL